jgi:hypothetical protein
MTQEQINEYYRQNMVIVQKGSFSETSKCEIKRCKHKPKHQVFLGASTRLSTIYAQSCSKHLPLICNKASNEGVARAKKWIASAKRKEVADAKNVLKMPVH